MTTKTGTRLPAWLPLLAAVLGVIGCLSGCASFKRVPVPQTVPPVYFSRTDVAQLTNPETFQAAYRRLFPPLPRVHNSGSFVGSSRLWPGHELDDFNFYAIGGEGPNVNVLNLQITKLQHSGINVIVSEGVMTFLDHQNHLAYQGKITADGTPFGKQLGVEPWDLIPIFTIGQQVATRSFTTRPVKAELELIPTTTTAEGKRLERIVLDRATGLPRSAFWRSGKRAFWHLNKRAFEIQYLSFDNQHPAWDYFTDSKEGIANPETRLMPCEIRVISSRPRVTIDLTMRTYQFNADVNPRMLNIAIPPGYQLYPLEMLNKVF